MPVANIQSQARTKPADIPLDKLVNSKALSEKDKTSEAARKFEAVLLRQILNDAQKPAIKSKFNLTGTSNSIYQDMMVNQMAETISSSQSLGLARELGGQMNRQLKIPPAGAATVANSSQASVAARPSSSSAAQKFKAIAESQTKPASGPQVQLTKATAARL
jgi:Rod binding domain-containing protein